MLVRSLFSEGRLACPVKLFVVDREPPPVVCSQRFIWLTRSRSLAIGLAQVPPVEQQRVSKDRFSCASKCNVDEAAGALTNFRGGYNTRLPTV